MEEALITWWTLAHISAGIAFGIVLNYRFFKKWKPGFSSLFTLFWLIAWEFFERYALAAIEFGNELIRNRIADVVIGFAAFLISYFFLRRANYK